MDGSLAGKLRPSHHQAFYLLQLRALCPRTYQDLFKRCVRQAGIRDTNFHALRHTFATRSLEQGMDVVTLSRLLGHANPSITMDKYGHALDDHKRSSIGKLGGLYAGAKKTPSPKRGQER